MAGVLLSESIEKMDDSVEKPKGNMDQSKENIVPVECSDIKAFQWFYDRNFESYFKFVKSKSQTSVVVECLLCPPQKTITVTVNSAYNLNSHLKVSEKPNSSTRNFNHIISPVDT
jgi:hypothetical protein